MKESLLPDLLHTRTYEDIRGHTRTYEDIRGQPLFCLILCNRLDITKFYITLTDNIMKKLKASLITFLGIVVLALAFTVYPPNQASASSDHFQYKADVCSGGWACNSCDPGTKACTWHSCAQCQPPGQ